MEPAVKEIKGLNSALGIEGIGPKLVELGEMKGNKKKIVDKQLKIAKTYRNISNKLDIDMRTAESKAVKDVEKSKKKYKIDEVIQDEKLDSYEAPSNSSIF